ncbi:hypothetical protein [Streptomyces sp. NPDC086023]|uniref:hypothetical protein n=1 Tax=Streptomyces sp. NPDC086023 TaxID=3365746 RepID=UPI0037D0BD6E
MIGVEAYVEDYRYVVRLHEASEQAFHDALHFARIMYPGSGTSPWKGLFDGASDIYYTHLADDRLKTAVTAFSGAPDSQNSQALCRAMEFALRQFTKEFTENHLAKRTEYWQAVRDYYASNPGMTPAGRCDDLKKVHEAVARFLEQLNTIAQLMERSRRDLFTGFCDVDLPGLTAEMSYWSDYIGQWFNHVWSWIPVEGSPAAQGTSAHQQTATTTASPQATAAAGPAAPQQQPAASAPSRQHSPSALGAVTAPSRPVVPKVEKAPTRKSAERGMGRRIRILGRLFSRETDSLGPDAERIANALKYNRMTMLLLLRRIRKDMIGVGSAVEEFHKIVGASVPWAKDAYPARVDAMLQQQLNAAEDAVEALKECEEMIRDGGNSGALVHAADAAEECNIALRAIGKHLDKAIVDAVSPRFALRLLDQNKQEILATSHPRAVQDDLRTISALAQKAGRRVHRIVERINQIVTDKDFTRKHLAFQGVERITGYAVRQESISPQCMNMIEDDIRRANRKARTLTR